MGRFEEAFSELKHAIQLEPLSLIIGTSYAGISWLGRRWDQAIEQTEKTLDLDPNFAAGLWGRARCYVGKGMVDTAISYAQEAVKLSGGTQLFFIADLGYAYARAGRTGDASRILDQLQELSKSRYVDSCLIAQIYVALGEVDEAFRWLERAFQERAAWVPYLAFDPWFDPLRSDTRFNKLLERLNFAA
jgi:tetratricopeptide (TPR) repeat protein